MNDALKKMMERYHAIDARTADHALREVLQEIALLGLWRAKFFEHAAFYGGTALRILYGLDRFSEDLDFSLLKPGKFHFDTYADGIRRELKAYGFESEFTARKAPPDGIHSAFLKLDTMESMLVVQMEDDVVRTIHPGKLLKVKFEIDVTPPMGFDTESKYLLQPIPFAVRSYTLPNLFAGKMHAVLCRSWKKRVKGRDLYDLVWYAANHPQLNLEHLRLRMVQSGHWESKAPMDRDDFANLFYSRMEQIDFSAAAGDVRPFIKDSQATALWSVEFFNSICQRIQF